MCPARGGCVPPDPCPHLGEMELGCRTEGGREGCSAHSNDKAAPPSSQGTCAAGLGVSPGTHQGSSGDLGQVKEEEEDVQSTAPRNLCVLGL